MRPELADVRSAAQRIAGVVVRTPLVPAPELSERWGGRVDLKLEGVQPTGSFKVRGAASKILSLSEAASRRGVVTASTGNHGRAMAYVAAQVGIPAAVCVSENVPDGKIAALRSLGCELVIGGDSQSAALETAAELVRERGMTLVHPFDDPQVIAGQGTLGLELVEDAEDVETVLVPLSGGGLISGVALAVKSLRPTARVVGISMEHGAVMAASLAAGHPVELPEEPTLADSLQGGIGLENRWTFRMCQELVDEVVLLTEDEIREAMGFAMRSHRLVLEGGAAVGVGAILADRVTGTGPAVVVCSGANAEPSQIEELAAAM